MPRGDFQSLLELVRHPTTGASLKLQHSLGKVTGLVKRCHAHIDVDKKLVECRSNGCEEAFPDVDSLKNGMNIFTGGEEIAISADSNGTSARWMSLNDDVEGGNQQRDVGVAVRGVTSLIAAGQMGICELPMQ
jgi:hypothetical protein